MAKKLGLRFQAPQNLDDALEVISTMSLFLDFWASRAGEWDFLQLLAKQADLSIWTCVAKCVVTKSGKNLQDVKFDQLGTPGVLEALSEFSKGLMDIELPQLYLDYCAGISTQSIINLVKDAERIRKECQGMSDPAALFGSLVTRALAGSL